MASITSSRTKHTGPHAGRGNVWENRGELARELADHGEAIRIDPKEPNLYSMRGDVWEHKADYDRAMADYDKAISLDPRFAAAYNGRASIWRNRRELDRAMTDVKEALRLQPGNPYFLASLADTRRSLAKGDLVRVLADHDHSVKLAPGDDIGYVLRGDTQRYKGDFKAALAD